MKFSHLRSFARRVKASSPTLYNRPVIPLLSAFICGIITGNRFQINHGIILACIIAPGIAVIIRFYQQKKAGHAPLLLFLALGLLAIKSYSHPQLPVHHYLNSIDNKKKTITGIITLAPEKKNQSLYLVLTIEKLSNGRREQNKTGKIRVTVREPAPPLKRGDRISFKGKIKPLHNFKNPGGFDYVWFMGLKGIYGSSYVAGHRISIVERAVKHRFLRQLDDFRQRIAVLIDQNVESPPAGLLKALIIGDRSDIPSHIREIFHRTGVGHLLAISGLHIGIIASTAFMGLVWFLSRFQYFLWIARTRSIAAMLTLVPVSLYGLLSGMSPSSQRAVIMVSVFLISYMVKRDPDHFNTLALAALVILMLSPPALFSISFQLSFAAVSGILLGLKSWPAPLKTEFNFVSRLLSHLVSFIKVSLFAILGTLPLSLFYFNQTSLIGLAANIIFIPIIGFAVVPLGLLSVGLYFIHELSAALCLKLAGKIVSMALVVMTHLANTPYAAIKTVSPSCLEICIYYGALLLLSTFFISSGIKKPRFLYACLIFGLFAISCLDVGYWIYERYFRSDLRVTILDVGQGSSAVIELPKGDVIVIDGGGLSDNSTFDIGARVVAPFLWQKKIKTVDTLMLSHANSDHLNGLLFLAEHFNVRRIITNGQAADTLGYKKLTVIIDHKNIHHPDYKTLSKKQIFNSVSVEIPYPPSDFMEKYSSPKEINNNSMVVKISLGAVSFLIPGDIMQKGEKRLAKSHPKLLNSTVLIAPHHGSCSSSSDPFLDRVQPQTVIISAGLKNRFHLPHKTILKKYRKRAYTLYRTDMNGAISMVTDGKELQIVPFLGN